jgi:hypothetical protein
MDDNIIDQEIEKEMGIQKWVHISIFRVIVNNDGRSQWDNKILLYEYNIPRTIYDRKQWILRWRTAKFQCQYPRDTINLSLSFYDKTSGIELAWNSVLNKLIAAKRNITKMRNKMAEYKKIYIPTIFNQTAESTAEWIEAERRLDNYICKQKELQTEVDLVRSKNLK